MGLIKAFLWFEIHLARQYRFALVSQLVQFFVFLLIFASLAPESAAASFDGMPYIQFVLTGLVYQIFYESVMNGPTSRMNELQMTGQLQVLLMAPYPRWAVLLASGAASSLAGAARALLVLVAGSLIFGVSFPEITPLPILLALVYTLAIGASLALLNIAGALLWPRVNLTSFFSSLLLAVLSGVFVPLDRLPEICRPLALVNPLRWGLDLFRSGFAQHVPVSAERWPLAIFAALAIALGAAAVFRRAERALLVENRYQNF